MTRILKAALVILALAAAGPAGAEEPRRFVVGVEELDYLPAYGFPGGDGSGDFAGYARSLLDAFAEDAGYELEYRPMPVPRLFASLLAATVDFKYPDSPNWSRDAKAGHAVTYSQPTMVHIDGTVVARAHDPEQIEILGTVTGFTPWAWMETIGRDEVHVVENADMAALIRQLLVGRIDGAYANVAAIKNQLESVLQRPGALVFRPDLPFDRGTYHLSTTLHPEAIAQFDAWLSANEARVAALQREYGVDEPAGLLPR